MTEGGLRLAIWRCTHAVMPCLIGVPVVAATIASVVALVGIEHPDVDWDSPSVASDGKALALGQPIYADPSDGYAGALYAPLFPAILGLLYRMAWWDGWSVLVAALSGAATAGLVGTIAATGCDDRPLVTRVAGGLGVGGLALWLVSTNQLHMLNAGRADQMAWFLALSGLSMLALDRSRSRFRAWPTVLLLTAALWSKQTTFGAIAAAMAVAAMWSHLGRAPWRSWRRLCGGLAILNAAVAVAVFVGSDGWAFRLMVDLPGRHAAQHSAGAVAGELLRHISVPAALVLLAGTALYRSGDGRTDRSPFVSLLAPLLLAFIAASLAPTWLARQKQGGGPNQWIGMMWAFGMLLALVHRSAIRSRSGLLFGSAAYVVALCIALIPAGSINLVAVDPAPIGETEAWRAMSPDIVTYADTHAVYLPRSGAIGTDEMWPTEAHVIDLLAAGYQPMHLIEALERRHFDAVIPFAAHPWETEYVSMAGRAEPQDLTKLNEVIAAGYGPGHGGAPAPLWGRIDSCLGTTSRRGAWSDSRWRSARSETSPGCA